MVAPPTASRTSRDLARGLLALLASRFVTIPLAIAVNAILARYLGAADFGEIYLATTSLALAFLLVEFGTTAQIAASVARDHASAARELGGGLLIRLGLGVPAVLAIPWVTSALGYSESTRTVFVLVGVRTLFASLAILAGSVVRGLERVHENARMSVWTALLDAVIVVPAVLLGWGLHGVLWMQVASAALGLLLWSRLLVRAGVGLPALSRPAAVALLRGGLGFVAFDVALKAQPYIDATFLKRLASPEAVGWYGAAARLVSSLLIPVSSINFVLYPTLARLWSSDREAFLRISRLGLRAVILFGVLAGVGSLSFAHVAVRLLFGAGFAPATIDLQVLSIYLFLLHSTMLLGCTIHAAQRQVRWAAVQFLCIPVSLSLDPWLVRRFQATTGNGGLGVCVSLAVAELLMLAGALVLTPRGIVTRALLVDLGRGLASGAAMGACAFLLRTWEVVAIPASVVTYFAAQVALGGLDRELVGQLRQVLGSKLGGGTPGDDPQPATPDGSALAGGPAGARAGLPEGAGAK